MRVRAQYQLSGPAINSGITNELIAPELSQKLGLEIAKYLSLEESEGYNLGDKILSYDCIVLSKEDFQIIMHTLYDIKYLSESKLADTMLDRIVTILKYGK